MLTDFVCYGGYMPMHDFPKKMDNSSQPILSLILLMTQYVQSDLYNGKKLGHSFSFQFERILQGLLKSKRDCNFKICSFFILSIHYSHKNNNLLPKMNQTIHMKLYPFQLARPRSRSKSVHITPGVSLLAPNDQAQLT